MRRIPLVLIFLLSSLCVAQEAPSGASVTIPWSEFKELLKAAEKKAPPPPVEAALTAVRLTAKPTRDSMQFKADFVIYVAEDKWVKVPILPASVSIGDLSGAEGMLTRDENNIYFVTNKKGRVEFSLDFLLPITEEAERNVVSLQVPYAAAALLTVTIPSVDVDVSVEPASATSTEVTKGSTTLRAVLPSGKTVRISWMVMPRLKYSFANADYDIAVTGKDTATVKLTAELRVFAKGYLNIPIASSRAAIRFVKFNGEEAMLNSDSNNIYLVSRSSGRHRIEAEYAVRVSRESGKPALELLSVGAAVTRLSFKLPQANQEITVEPGSGIVLKSTENATTLTALIPPTTNFKISWTEAVVGEVKVRLYSQSVHVLRVNQSVVECVSGINFSVFKGEVSKLLFSLPPDASVRKVTCDGMRDWRQKENTLTIYLTGKTRQTYRATIEIERLLKKLPDDIGSFIVRPDNVERDRGFIVVEKNDDYEFKPTVGAGVVRTGAEELPPDAKKLIRTAALTFRYVRTPFELKIQVEKVKEKDAELYAQIDTLATVREGGLRCSATVNLNIYKAPVSELTFRMPSDVSLLNVSAPYMRNYEVTKDKDSQLLKIFLTTRVRNSYSCSVVYERMLEQEKALTLPTISLVGAKIESGFIAMKSETNVEITPSKLKGARRVDVMELPAHLLGADARTILLAFHYPRRPYSVEIALKRYEDVEVRPSIIESANFTTVLTEEGVLVTNAELTVRNRDRQFMRVAMPEGSEIWSLTVAGKNTTPAKDEKGNLLVPLERSKMVGQELTPFTVKIVYRTLLEEMGWRGSGRLMLPRPNITTNQLFWSVYLPAKYIYYGFRGNVDWLKKGYSRIKAAAYAAAPSKLSFLGKKVSTSMPKAGVTAQQQALNVQAVRQWRAAAERQVELEKELFRQIQRGKATAVMPVTVAMPTEGKLYRFKKLYPTEAPEPPYLNLAWARGGWRVVLPWWKIPVELFAILLIVLLCRAVVRRRKAKRKTAPSDRKPSEEEKE